VRVVSQCYIVRDIISILSLYKVDLCAAIYKGRLYLAKFLWGKKKNVLNVSFRLDYLFLFFFSPKEIETLWRFYLSVQTTTIVHMYRVSTNTSRASFFIFYTFGHPVYISLLYIQPTFTLHLLQFQDLKKNRFIPSLYFSLKNLFIPLF